VLDFKYTTAKLDFITDPDMHLRMEKIWGGEIAIISHRYAQSNNPLVEGVRPFQT